MTASLNNHQPNLLCEMFLQTLATNKIQEQDIYLTAVMEGDEKGIRKIYKDLMPLITAIVRKNKGTTDDAQDVFQDALMIVFQKAQNSELDINGSFRAYFTGVCKYVWMNKRRRKHRQDISIDTESFHSLEDRSDNLDKLLHQREMNKLFKEKFELLETWQQQLLTLSFEGKTHKEIAKIMSFSSEGYTKKKKFIAKRRLIELIQADPKYREMVS